MQLLHQFITKYLNQSISGTEKNSALLQWQENKLRNRWNGIRRRKKKKVDNCKNRSKTGEWILQLPVWPSRNTELLRNKRNVFSQVYRNCQLNNLCVLCSELRYVSGVQVNRISFLLAPLTYNSLLNFNKEVLIQLQITYCTFLHYCFLGKH